MFAFVIPTNSSINFSFAPVVCFFVSVVCPTGPYPPLRPFSYTRQIDAGVIKVMAKKKKKT